MNIILPEFTALDISLRLMCLGQLWLFMLILGWQIVKSRAFTLERALLLLLIGCCACAVVLTGQYRPDWLKSLRPVLLAFTDALAFVFWAYGTLSLRSSKLSFLPKCIWLVGGGIYLLWHAYFFILLEGKGVMHDVVHVAAALAVAHLAFLCIRQWHDDLVDSRRRFRAVLLVLACIVFAIYVTSELSGLIFMRTPEGSLIGAVLFLSFSITLGVYALTTHPATQYELSTTFDSQQSGGAPVSDVALGSANSALIPESYRKLHQELTLFMEAQGFIESGLTLTRLAERLSTQEHRLRILINQSLGYQNFSHYLNDHRLPLACELLENQPHLMITKLAYDLGYGSITSFNRAFKDAYGVTPSTYRSGKAAHKPTVL